MQDEELTYKSSVCSGPSEQADSKLCTLNLGRRCGAPR